MTEVSKGNCDRCGAKAAEGDTLCEACSAALEAMIQSSSKEELVLAYAIWDAENSVRLETPSDLSDHVTKARNVISWLKVHGAEIRIKRKDKRSNKKAG